jgi:malonyl-CoA/methylmalonyl-CoA synthetase
MAGTFARLADKVLLASPAGGMTGRELALAVARYAAVLEACGVQAGDRVLVQAEKSLDGVLAYVGVLHAGAVHVPLNTAYTLAELGYFVADASPRLVVCDAARHAALEPLARACGAACIALDGEGGLADRARVATPLASARSRAGDDLAAIVYTSGTTGRSKGAMLTHGNLLSNARALVDLWGFRTDDVLLHALPIYHVHGLFVALHTALLCGARIELHERFDAAAVAAALASCTVFMGVPTYYTRLLEQPALTAERCRGMRLFVSGSAPLLPATFAAFEARTGHRILERYGMSEAGMITSNPLAGERLPGTVGMPLPGVEVRVRTPDGARATGGPGVLEIRGPNVFAGYWNMPERTRAEFTDDGWFVTGDVGTIAGDGRVSIVGRDRDLVISGGLNVYPKEVELALDALAGVAESAVFGVAHPDFGEAVLAAVVPAGGPPPDTAALLAALRGRMAPFKVPKALVVVDALPRNAMGKVQKNVLRERYARWFA